MSAISYALRMAKDHYIPKTYDHAIRVAAYVAENEMIPDDKMDFCIALGIMHDLLEDTDYSASDIDDGRFRICLELLTKKDNMTYEEYIKKIKSHSGVYPEVYWVKLADIKDHLTQKETLTDKLLEKYLNALPELL